MITSRRKSAKDKHNQEAGVKVAKERKRKRKREGVA
jgi:hypothetical protein